MLQQCVSRAASTYLRAWISLMALLFFIPALSGAEKPDLTGMVKDASGKSLPGATVFIYTAAPKEGPGVLCPSCYADCRKQATTDAEGRFKIEELDPSLTFKLLVVAKGNQPEFVSKVDPVVKPVEVSLKPVSGGSFPQMRLRGKVVDAHGKPVHGAVASVDGVTSETGTTYGSDLGIDPVAVSDENGMFTLHARLPFKAVNLNVESRSFAKAKFNDLKSGDTEHVLKLGEGVSVTGRVLKDGQPLSGIEVGMSGVERWAGVYIGNFSVATSAEGRFLFANMPPNYAYQFYGIMKSLKEQGVVASRVVRTGAHGATLDLGDIELTPGFVIAGQVKLADGKPVPGKTRLLLNRQEAWDTQQVDADAEGNFKFYGVPAESIGLSARADGHRLTIRNASIDPNNPYHLIGRVTTNKLDLVIELEPGSRSLDRLPGNQLNVKNEPLRGVETAGPNPGDIKVTGSVIDAETRIPLAEFTVTPGREDRYSRGAEWASNRKTVHKNGDFITWFSTQPQAPVVLIEAKGYLPQVSAPIKAKETNLVFTMQKGSGYFGVVKLPDGRPAADVHVYLTDARNGVYIVEDGHVRNELYRDTKSTRTDDYGRFSFAPKVDAFTLCVHEPSGFAEVRIEDFQKNPVVQMQALGKVEGKLMIGTQPGAKEVVRLSLSHIPYRYHPRSFAPISLFMTTTTKVDGTFIFDCIPPGPVEISHSPKVKDKSMGMIPISQNTSFVLQPGETRKLILGGQGRPLIGKIVITGYEDKINWRSEVQSLELVVPEPDGIPSLLTMMREYSSSTRSAKKEDLPKLQAEYQKQREKGMEKLVDFYRTEAGLLHHFSKKKYALNFQQDGTFRVEDVPAGKYTLNFELRENGADRFSPMSGNLIASTKQDIEVPTIPGGRSDEPLDIGSIELQARGSMKSGKAAPEFSVKTLDGKDLKLADFKGKYVLLDFWAVWCGPCVAETPHLKAAYELIKDNPKFAMIGLSLDPEKEAPIEYAKKNQLGWIQGFLGEWAKTQVPNQYGVQGIPSIMLIGPDGKIVATGLRGPAIKAALESALTK